MNFFLSHLLLIISAEVSIFLGRPKVSSEFSSRKIWLVLKKSLLLHSLIGTTAHASPVSIRSLKELYKTFVEKYKEQQALLFLIERNVLGKNNLVNSKTYNKYEGNLGITEKQTKLKYYNEEFDPGSG